jgi:hypothetical protein
MWCTVTLASEEQRSVVCSFCNATSILADDDGAQLVLEDENQILLEEELPGEPVAKIAGTSLWADAWKTPPEK